MISAVLIAGSLVAAPCAVAMEEFLVSLNADTVTSASKPEEDHETPKPPDNMPDRRTTLKSVRNKRFSELTSKTIIVIARDKNGEEINPSVLFDPRLIRAEISSPEAGEVVPPDQIQHEDTDFIVDFPDDAGIDKIQFYHPRWTGTAFTLELIGETQVQ